MVTTFTCAVPTPLLPTLNPGSIFDFDGQQFHAYPTRKRLHHICAALAEGSVIASPSPDPLYDELERRIMADRDALFVRADSLLHSAPAAHLREAS